jgi:PilZ domain-containing protein
MAFFQRRAQFVELRKSPRHEVHYPAHVEISGSPTPVNCVICDISAAGAKLTIRGVETFPEEFTLLFRRRCRVVHRFDGQIGVQFV